MYKSIAPKDNNVYGQIQNISFNSLLTYQKLYMKYNSLLSNTFHTVPQNKYTNLKQ